MIITQETSLENFEFWGGAKDLADNLTHKELELVESCLEDAYPEGMTDAALNDIFAYEGDMIAEWIGYEKEEDILMRDSTTYLLDRARDFISDIREEWYYPEFSIEDEEVIDFCKDNNMSLEEFADEGIKGYIGMLEEVGDMSEVDDLLADYEDTIEYIRLEMLDKEIKDKIDAISNSEIVPDLEAFRDKVVEKLEDLSNYIHKDSEREKRIELLVDDMNMCDGFVIEDYER